MREYEVSRHGQVLMHGPLECRYPPELELQMLEAGYEIRVNGKKLTKKGVRAR